MEHLLGRLLLIGAIPFVLDTEESVHRKGDKNYYDAEEAHGNGTTP